VGEDRGRRAVGGVRPVSSRETQVLTVVSMTTSRSDGSASDPLLPKSVIITRSRRVFRSRARSSPRICAGTLQ